MTVFSKIPLKSVKIQMYVDPNPIVKDKFFHIFFKWLGSPTLLFDQCL